MSIRLKISVTKDIIEKSKHCGGDPKSVMKNCAIALAVREIFPKAEVSDVSISPFGRDAASSTIWLPKIATRWIKKFDNRKPWQRVKMPEIDFEVEVPSYVVRKINIDELRTLLQNHHTLEIIDDLKKHTS